MGFPVVLSALHIIGGDMTYVCNGNGSYTITMKVYRDGDSGGAPYDNPGYVAVYNGFGNFVSQHTMTPTNISTIQPDDNPCVEFNNPPNVQTATYTITLNLPLSNQSYYISYQRCCRNETINNIMTPGDVGATYTVEITPIAQQFCNNSPVFNDFPPIVICAGEFINFDHSASDVEGDSLVYSFCSPLIGGGIDGGPDNPNGDPNGPTGVQPIPPTGPPYNSVTFVSPTYTPFTPMAGNPTILIDPQTGVIDGVPEILGQFVVGVCVKEYRDGVLIGEIRRDFQFNVITCNPFVDADIQADVLIGEDEYLINLCGDDSNLFINESLSDINSPTTYYWDFDLQNGSHATSTDTNFQVTFPGIGSYEGILIVNPQHPCTDTAYIHVNVHPAITADFEFSYDTCDAAPVDFTNLTVADAGEFTSTWDFGDGETSNEFSPDYEYLIPGDFEVSLFVRDTNLCEDEIIKPLSYFPAPNSLIIDASAFEGCAPQYVFFDNLSYPIDSTYFIDWEFGDSTFSNEISPTHLYEEPGTYQVSLNVVSPIGCEVEVPFNSSVIIRPTPTAGFSVNPESLTNFSPTAQFTDESIDADAVQWNFGDGSPFIYDRNPEHTFGTGTFEVVQVVRHESGCLDTAVYILNSELLVTYHLPNAFTPNGDGKNEGFKGTGYFEGITNFRMTIWNRWGELIFETSDPNEAWNGRKNNEGDLLQSGVYVVVVEYLEPSGNKVKLNGFATLLR